MDPRFQLEFECHEAWDEMREVEPGQRRCERCSETVVDLSRMTKKRALAIVTSERPPCVNYLVVAGEPVFAREVLRGGVLAAAAGLLAACSAPAEPPSLAPEPEVHTSLLDPGAPFGALDEGPVAVPSSVGAPSLPQSSASNASSSSIDHASAGDRNDVDGAAPTSASTNGGPPPAWHSAHMARGRIARPSRVVTPPPVALDRNR